MKEKTLCITIRTDARKFYAVFEHLNKTFGQVTKSMVGDTAISFLFDTLKLELPSAEETLGFVKKKMPANRNMNQLIKEAEKERGTINLNVPIKRVQIQKEKTEDLSDIAKNMLENLKN